MTRFQPKSVNILFKTKITTRRFKDNQLCLSNLPKNSLQYTTKFKQPLQLALQVNCIHYLKIKPNV